MYPHFMGRARRRCGTSVPSRCLLRPSWPSSSWTAIERKREPLWLSFPIKQARRRLRRMQQAVFKAAPRLAYTNVAAEWPAQHRHDRGACNRSLLTCCLCRSSLPDSLPGIPRMATAIRRNPASPLDLTRFAPVEAAGSSLPAAFQKETPS